MVTFCPGKRGRAEARYIILLSIENDRTLIEKSKVKLYGRLFGLMSSYQLISYRSERKCELTLRHGLRSTTDFRYQMPIWVFGGSIKIYMNYQINERCLEQVAKYRLYLKAVVMMSQWLVYGLVVLQLWYLYQNLPWVTSCIKFLRSSTKLAQQRLKSQQ